MSKTLKRQRRRAEVTKKPPPVPPIRPAASTPTSGPLRVQGRTNEERAKPFADRLLANLKAAHRKVQ